MNTDEIMKIINGIEQFIENHQGRPLHLLDVQRLRDIMGIPKEIQEATKLAHENNPKLLLIQDYFIYGEGYEKGKRETAEAILKLIKKHTYGSSSSGIVALHTFNKDIKKYLRDHSQSRDSGTGLPSGSNSGQAVQFGKESRSDELCECGHDKITHRSNLGCVGLVNADEEGFGTGWCSCEEYGKKI